MSNPFPEPLSFVAEFDPDDPEPPEWRNELDDLYGQMPKRMASTLSERWRNVEAGPATYFAEIQLARIALLMIQQMHDQPRRAKEGAWRAFTATADALMHASEQGENAWSELSLVAEHARLVMRQKMAEGASNGGRTKAEKRREQDAIRDSAICAAWKKSQGMTFNSLRRQEAWVSEQVPTDGPPWSRSVIRRVVQKNILVQKRNGSRA